MVFLMKDIDLIEIAKEILPKTKVGYLATIDANGFPQIRAIDNLRSPDRFFHAAQFLAEQDNSIDIYISTNTSSTKVKEMKENSAVSIYFCLSDEFKGIMIQGFAEEITDLEFKKKIWCDGWEMFYPKGYSDPDFTIIRVQPKSLKSWYQTNKHEMKLSEE